MRLAFSTLAFPSRTLAGALAAGHSYGYEGVELRLVDGALIDGSMSKPERDRVRLTLDAAGMPVVAVDSSVQVTAAGAEDELHRLVKLAHHWEAPVVRVFGGPLAAEKGARSEQLRAAAALLGRAAPRAADLGVSVAVETHDSFAASEVVAQLLDLVPAPAIGAVWDSHHTHRMGETPEEVFGNLGPRIKLVQVKDAARDPSDPSGWKLVLLGRGEVPVQGMVEVLARGGYDGWVSVEWEKLWHPEIEEPEVALPQHLDQLVPWLAQQTGKFSNAESAG